MNKHILNQRLSSIEHYGKEIEKLEAAKKVTIETRDELVKSVVDFFPFSTGDIITNGIDRFYKLGEIIEVHHSIGQLYAYPMVYGAKNGGGWQNSPERISIYLKDWDKWQIVKQPKEAAPAV